MPKLSNVKTGAPAQAGSESPSQQLVAGSDHVEIDSKGRAIKVRSPGILAQYRLIEALGNDSAGNDTYVRMVMPILYVVQIDDDALPPLRTKAEVEALIQRLDDHGMKAVMKGIVAISPKKKSDKEEMAAIKK